MTFFPKRCARRDALRLQLTAWGARCGSSFATGRVNPTALLFPCPTSDQPRRKSRVHKAAAATTTKCGIICTYLKKNVWVVYIPMIYTWYLCWYVFTIHVCAKYVRSIPGILYANNGTNTITHTRWCKPVGNENHTNKKKEKSYHLHGNSRRIADGAQRLQSLGSLHPSPLCLLRHAPATHQIPRLGTAHSAFPPADYRHLTY